MLFKSTLLLLLVFVALLIPGPTLAEWPTDPTVTNPVCTTSSPQYNVQSFSDEAGGTYISWREPRSGEYHVYVQHLDGDGNATWAADGLLACTYTASQQYNCDAAADGTGGLIVVWQDVVGTTVEIYAQRFSTSGYVWNPQGLSVCINTGDQISPKVVADGSGSGGSFVVWTDERVGEDIYAQRLSSTGTRLWGTSGVAVCTDAETQNDPLLVADGSGGVIIVWNDSRSSDTFAARGQRLNLAGTPLWTPDGRALSNIWMDYNQEIIQIITDGSGGAYFSLDEHISGTGNYRSYVFHIDGDGSHQWSSSGLKLFDETLSASGTVLVPDGNNGIFTATMCEFIENEPEVWVQHFNPAGHYLWTQTGIPACGGFGAEYSICATSDNQGGMAVGWTNHRLGAASLYVQRFNVSGTRLWSNSGAIASQASEAFAENLLTDETGGTIIVGQSFSGSGELFAQRLDTYGYLADPCPAVTSITDFPNDQGGQVTVAWEASYLDTPEYLKVTEYSVWMREPETKTIQLDEQAYGALADSKNWSVESIQALAKAGWGFVDVVPALYETDYCAFGPTFGDSTAVGIPYIEYRIVAHTTDHWIMWESEPASGYSVDNIAPGVPQAILAGYLATGVTLDWDDAPENDFQYHRVYRGSSLDFVPSAANLVHETASSVWTDPTAKPWGYNYKITTLDYSGNESEAASPSEVTGVRDGTVPTRTALLSAVPNPFNPSTKLSFEMVAASHARLKVYDTAGRLVTTLVNERRDAGLHEIIWDGRDHAGRISSAGVYLYRLEVGDFIETKRMTLVK